MFDSSLTDCYVMCERKTAVQAEMIQRAKNQLSTREFWQFLQTWEIPTYQEFHLNCDELLNVSKVNMGTEKKISYQSLQSTLTTYTRQHDVIHFFFTNC